MIPWSKRTKKNEALKRFRGKAFWRQLLKSSATNNSIRVNIPSSLPYIRSECLVNTSLAKDNYKPFAFIACDWSFGRANASQTANDYHSASQALRSASSRNKRFTYIDNNSPQRKKNTHVSDKQKPESTNPVTLSVFIRWCNFLQTIPYVYRCARVFHDVTRLKARILVKNFICSVICEAMWFTCFAYNSVFRPMRLLADLTAAALIALKHVHQPLFLCLSVNHLVRSISPQKHHFVANEFINTAKIIVAYFMSMSLMFACMRCVGDYPVNKSHSPASATELYEQ